MRHLNFKFLHAADIHLDSPLHKLDTYEGAPVAALRQASRRAFENLVRCAVAEKVAFVLIAGDLYDGDWKDYNTGLYFVAQTRRLRAAGIPVVMVAGNHDAASRITRDLRLPDGAHLLPADRPTTLRLEGPQVAVHGQSFATAAVRENLAVGFPPPVANCFNIGLLHTCATGRQGHEPYAPCSLQDLKRSGYDYWALGHVHQREILLDDPPVVFPGNLQGRNIRETGPKGAMLVTVGENQRCQVEFRPLDVIRWLRLELDCSQDRSADEVAARFARRLEGALTENGGLPLVVRTVIKGQTEAHAELAADVEHWTGELRAVALDVGGGQVWVEKIKLGTGPPLRPTDLKPAEGAVGEVARLLTELGQDPQPLCDLCPELADLEKKLPRDIKDGAEGIGLTDPKWLAGLLDQIQPLLLSRLIAKGGRG
jgi:exonuclease SbcD